MQTQSQLAPTTAIYLFADQFSEPAKGLLTQGAFAPRTGEKVAVKPLVVNLYMAALMELLESGVARMEIIEVRKFLGKEQVPALILSGNSAPLNALAMRMAKAVEAAKKPEHHRVREIVISLVGGRASTMYPWYVALQPVITQAIQDGYIQRPEKKPGLLKAAFQPASTYTEVSPTDGVLSNLQHEAEAARAKLAAFEQKLGPTAEALRKEINSGVSECQERSSD